MRRTALLLLGLLAVGLAAGWSAYVVFGRGDVTAGAGPPVEVSITDWRWAPRDELPPAETTPSEPVEE